MISRYYERFAHQLKLFKPLKMPRKRPSKSKSSKAVKGSFRIIAGEWRSRRFEFEEQEGLRPTTDRVRETVFNWLSPYIEGSTVLDLFAGSGVLGIEALSRGASHCTFVELNRTTNQNISRILEQLQCAKASVCQQDALLWLESARQDGANKYDIIFLDPPFRTGLMAETLKSLDEHPLLGSGALIYVELELENRNLDVPSNWQILKDKSMGQVCYRLYQAG